MDNLIKAVADYEKAGENVKNAAWIAFMDNKIDISIQDGHELMDRLNLAEISGARAERRILEAVAITKARETSIKR